MAGRKIYIGNLPDNIREREVEDIFYKFGRIRLIDIKTPSRPPAYAFVEYDDPRDAEEAVRRRDGYDLGGGYRIRVELARGGSGFARENFRPPRSTGYRVVVKNLPRSASWQDLKDFVRKAVKPVFTDVSRSRDGDGIEGIVEFETYDDMKLAIKKLDDTEFNNPRYEKCYVRLYEDRPGGGSYRDDRDRARRSRSRSRSRSPRGSPRRSPRGSPRRSPSRSRSRSRGRSPSRSPSRSRSPPPPAAGRGRSASRSRSRSPARKDSPARSD